MRFKLQVFYHSGKKCQDNRKKQKMISKVIRTFQDISFFRSAPLKEVHSG